MKNILETIIGIMSVTFTILIFASLITWRVSYVHHKTQTLYCPNNETRVVNYFAIPLVQNTVSCIK